jgi:hypothetical protein
MDSNPPTAYSLVSAIGQVRTMKEDEDEDEE